MAGNPHKGEVEFTALGGREFRLRYDTNAICELEEELDCGISEIAQRLSRSPRMSIIRAVFRAGIVGGEVSVGETGQIIDEIGGPRTIELLRQAFELSLPMQGAAEARPTVARRAGTGRASS